MAAVTRILPRDWDGHRLLRFLAGLALIALSFAIDLHGVDAGSVRPAGASGHPPAAAAAAPAVARPPDSPPPAATGTGGPDGAVAARDVAASDIAAGDIAARDITGGDVVDGDAAQATLRHLLALPALAPAGGVSDAPAAPPAATAPSTRGSRAPPHA